MARANIEKSIREKQTALFDELGVFIAFGDKQFNENRKEGVEYCTVLGVGDCVPKKNAPEFARRLSALHKEGRDQLLENVGLDKVIEDELINHECYYTGDITDAVEALEFYGASHEQVLTVYRNTASKHQDW